MCVLPLVHDPCPIITAFVLDLKSAYEGEHVIVGLLSLANFA
jgi:hypothetical protein